MSQSAIVAFIVIAAFGVGVLTGRAMVSPSQGPAPVAQQQAPMAAAPSEKAGMPSFPPSAPMMPQNHPPVGNAPAAAAPAGADGALPAGTVAEVMQVPNYTYLRITTQKGDVWAAVNSNPALAVGQKVALAQDSVMENFASKTLNRTFDQIWFGSLSENSN